MSDSVLATFLARQNEAIPEVRGDFLAEYANNGEFKLNVWVPSEMTGKIIGKSGSIVNNIRQKTKARVINAQPAVTGSLWAPVVVIGEWASIVSAYGALSELVDGEIDDVVLEFTLNYRK
eukprot:gene24216-29909_t